MQVTIYIFFTPTSNGKIVIFILDQNENIMYSFKIMLKN